MFKAGREVEILVVNQFEASNGKMSGLPIGHFFLNMHSKQLLNLEKYPYILS